MTHNTCNILVLQYIYIYIMYVHKYVWRYNAYMCGFPISQYGILTSSVNTVHVTYMVLSHSSKYNIIVEQYIIEYNIGNESIRNFLPGDMCITHVHI